MFSCGYVSLFFFKQKTAYDMRISDWSSDVCSSDLGVGRSQGVFDRGEGELSDAASALDWLQTYNDNAASCWIAGFSFGAWIGMQLLMRRPEINGFVSVAPPANMHDFSFLAPCPSSGLIVPGDKEQVVPEGSVKKLVDKLSSQRGIAIDYRDRKSTRLNSRH